MEHWVGLQQVLSGTVCQLHTLLMDGYSTSWLHYEIWFAADRIRYYTKRKSPIITAAAAPKLINQALYQIRVERTLLPLLRVWYTICTSIATSKVTEGARRPPCSSEYGAINPWRQAWLPSDYWCEGICLHFLQTCISCSIPQPCFMLLFAMETLTAM
eukprot:SAG31_NODE_10368_length_1147_cov_1.413168_1_plen_158_part_00